MKSQAGFNLIEVMIASVISIFLLTGMLNLFITTNKSVSLSDGISQNQETGRFSMDYLSKFIRIAGYSTEMTNPSPPLSIASATIDCSIGDICSENDVATIRGDRLALPISTAAGETMRSCTGTNIGLANANQQYISVFWVSLNENNSDKELRCRVFNLSTNTWLDFPTSILSNIEQMHFQVGLADDASQKQVSRYTSVDQVLDLNLVRSIRVGILATSSDDIDANKLRTTVDTRKYTVLDGPTLTTNDGNFRNIFTTTIELLNTVETAN